MKKLLLIQPGAFGDIVLCAPIAKWYSDLGYHIDWPIRKKFLSTLQYFDYVNPIILSEDELHSDWLRSDVMKTFSMFSNYDKVINLADRGPHSTAQLPNENFEQCKYRLSEVPFSQKHNLVWKRNIEKELQLMKLLNISENEDYALIHNIDSLNQSATLPEISLKRVEVTPINGYNIFDWYTVIKNAKQIYAIESSVHQFIDGIATEVTENKYLLKRPAVPENCRFTVSSYWKLDYIGKNSTIRG